MDIRAMSGPFAGEQFRFHVSGTLPPTRIVVYIDQAVVLSKDCDDPPCHETVSIPPGTKGSEVRIIASDPTGLREEQRFTVRDAESSAGGMM